MHNICYVHILVIVVILTFLFMPKDKNIDKVGHSFYLPIATSIRLDVYLKKLGIPKSTWFRRIIEEALNNEDSIGTDIFSQFSEEEVSQLKTMVRLFNEKEKKNKEEAM